MRSALILLALLLPSVMVTKVDGRQTEDYDPCPPITCAYGYHSVCVQKCDPNVPAVCRKICVCHCEKDKKGGQFDEDQQD